MHIANAREHILNAISLKKKIAGRGGVLLLHTLLEGGSELRLLWARKETKLN